MTEFQKDYRALSVMVGLYNTTLVRGFPILPPIIEREDALHTSFLRFIGGTYMHSTNAIIYCDTYVVGIVVTTPVPSTTNPN